LAHISLRNVVIEFPIVHGSSRSLQLRLYQALGGKLTSAHNTVVVRALDGIDLVLRDGDRLGLIGHNGSGKTTLLRVLAGVYPPGRGVAEISGSVSSFTDITLGMDPESTGWENIIFRCVFMGLSFEQAKRLSPTIAEFSELGPYLDLPTRTYSTGMYLRLAFAISTSVQPDILVMDEMISAGDLQFMEKAKQRLEEIVGRTSILAIASHDLHLIRTMCSKAIWLEQGSIKMVGSPESVVRAYEELYAEQVPPAFERQHKSA
jgi:ABC-type polysaccharide/polyol phosphate transport system ATPase subunit